MNQIDQAYAGVRCRPLPFWRRVLNALRRVCDFYGSNPSSTGAALLGPIPDLPPSAPAVRDPVPAAGALPTLTLGEIQRRLAPVSITAYELAYHFDIAHASTRGVQKLYFEEQWPLIKAAIVKHVQGLTR